MSYPGSPDPNPYASPMAPPATVPITSGGPPQNSLDYMRAYNYIFENPNWVTTILLLGLCCVGMMIPILGIVVQLFILGYQFETIDLLMKSHGRQYPDFDFGRLGEYLARGLWPFLINLIASFVLLPVIYLGFGIIALIVMGISSAAGDTLGPILGIGLGVVGGVAFIAAAFAFNSCRLRDSHNILRSVQSSNK